MNPTSIMPPAPQTGTDPNANNDPSQFGDYSDWAKGEMAKGATADQLHQHLQQNDTQYGAAAPQKKGNWFTHLLPTIGSMAIPAIGALLAPETGGLSLLAAAGLSGAGAAGGKAAENAAEGKQVLDKGVLNEGIMGTAGGLVGGVAGKAFGKGAEALAGRAASIEGSAAAKTAAEDAIETAANTYKDISPKLQKALNMKDSLAHVKNMGYGVEDPTNLMHVSNTSNDVLNDTLNRALAGSGPVDLSHYPSLIKEALAKEGGTLGSYEKVALARGRLGNAGNPASKLLQQLEDLGAGVAKSNSDPNELRTLTTKLGSLAQDAKPGMSMATGAVDPQQRAIYNVINDVRGNVKDALYNRPEMADVIKKEVGNLVADPGKNISQQLADHLNKVITESKDPQGLLDEISRNINIGRLGEEGQKVGQIVTSSGGKARAAAEAGLGNPGVDTHPMLEAANMVHPNSSAIGTVANVVKHAKDNPAILSTLSRIGAMGEKLAPAAGSAIATAPNLQADPAAMQPGAGGDYGPGGGTNGTMGGNMNMQGNGTAPTDMASILSQYMHMGSVDPYLLSSTTPLVQALAPAVQKQQMAGTSLNAIPQSFANAGGAQGTGGILSHIASMIPGTAAHTYNAQRQAAAAQLAQAMGISPEQAMGLLPDVMQNGQTAGMTQGILGNIAGQLSH